MAEIINLNKARKAKQKAEAQKKAADNRGLFGISSKLRKLNKAKDQKVTQRHEGHKLIKPDAGSSAQAERGSDPSRTTD